jgi:hypothetical protein
LSFGPHTITILQRGWDGSTRDRQNNPVITQLGTFSIAGCFVQQQGADEDTEGRETDVSRWVAICPPPAGGASVGHIDHVRVTAADIHVDPDPGETFATFRQVGEPDALDHIDGSFHHLELVLERVQL